MNVPCGDENYYFGNVVTGITEPTLGYVCEARVLKSANSSETCYFPFVYQGDTYTSCSMKIVYEFNPAGKPWCATAVDQNSVVLPGKWIICEDERQIIYDGSGAGFQCPMPFIFNRVHFDFCTKKKPDGSAGFADYYWCPDPNFVNDSNEYTANEPIGKCTEFLYPKGTPTLSQSCYVAYIIFRERMCRAL